MNNLKPCPFCGGEAGASIISMGGSGTEGNIHFKIQCKDCGATATSTTYVAMGKLGNGLEVEFSGTAMEKATEDWNRRAEAKEKGKEKAKPAWMPITGEDGETVGTFAFCPHCGIVLSQFVIDGKKIGEKSCRNCGTEITWEGYPQKFEPETRKREKPDDI